ncbi:MAG: hypothetical protein OHK0024_34270 [Thalassobaculales bacterium]
MAADIALVAAHAGPPGAAVKHAGNPAPGPLSPICKDEAAWEGGGSVANDRRPPSRLKVSLVEP